MTRPYQVLAPAARPVIAEWLEANSRYWHGETIPSAILDAWMTEAENGQFMLEIPAHHSVTGVPVTLSLQAYAVDGPETDGGWLYHADQCRAAIAKATGGQP